MCIDRAAGGSFSKTAKFCRAILSIVAGLLLALASFGGIHRSASIWLFFVSTVMYVVVLWLFHKKLFPRKNQRTRNIAAILLIGLALVVFGALDVRSRSSSTEQPSQHYRTYGDQSPIMPNNQGTVIIDGGQKAPEPKKENEK